MSNNQSFGSMLKTERLKHNLTQQVIAEKLHIDRSLVSKYESDKIIPNDFILRDICNLFELEFDECKAILLKNFSKRTSIFRLTLAILFTIAVAMVFVLVIPYLKYPDYSSPYIDNRQITYSSILVIAGRSHNPIAVISLIAIVNYISFIVFSFFNKKMLYKTVVIIGVLSILIFLLFAIVMFIVLRCYYRDYYYPKIIT